MVSIWRKLALVFWPTLLSGALAALGLAAAAPLTASENIAQRLALAAAGLAALILVWTMLFVGLRRRYLWLARHPEAEAPALTGGQWLEVLFGALAAAAVAGLLALAAVLLRRGYTLADPYLAAPPAAAVVAGYLTGLWVRASCRKHNRPGSGGRSPAAAPDEAAPAGGQRSPQAG